MKRLLTCALVIALAACTPDDSSATTSAAVDSVTSAVSDPTASTSPTAGPTTTQPLSTTTFLEGTWASVPLVVYDDWGGMALGWWDGAGWVQVDDDTSLPVSGGETYQVALLGSQAVLEGSSPTDSGCDVVSPDGLPGVQLSDGNALYTMVSDGTGGERSISGVAISASWDIHPRPAVPGEWHPDLENLAFQLLGDRGFVTDSVNNVQSIDADLDGDGALETLIVIEDTRLADSESGVYSMVFIVTPSSDEVFVVAESVIPPNDAGYPESYRVSAVADLSGDGIMEVVLSGLGWEASWVTVYEYTGGEFVDRISAGCGV